MMHRQQQHDNNSGTAAHRRRGATIKFFSINCALNHMTLIKETPLDSKEFLERRQFWVGESSKKTYNSSKCRAKGGGKAGKRKLLRSVVQSTCNSLSDDNIINCNRLFWSNKHSAEGPENISIWGLAKELGVTFSGEEEEIIKELESMDSRDRIQGNANVGIR